MKLFRVSRSLARSLLFASVLAFGVCVFLVETIPAMIGLYAAPQYLLLLIVIFGIIEVRLPQHESAPRDSDGRRIWPYVLSGMIALGVLVYSITAPSALVWRILVAVYGAIVLATVLMTIFEE